MNYIPGHWRAGAVFALQRDTTAVGNIGSGTDNLISYTLPANVLSQNGRGLRITAYGSTANNANPKTVALLFGGTTVATQALTTGEAGRWRIVAEVFRTAEDAQDWNSVLLGSPTAILKLDGGTATENDGATIVIKCTGTVTDGGSGINNNDIVQDGLMVEVIH